MNEKEKDIFEEEMKRTVIETKIKEFHEIIDSQDYSALDASIKTINYVLVLIDSYLNKDSIITLLKEWTLICDIKRLHLLDDMERCQPTDED